MRKLIVGAALLAAAAVAVAQPKYPQKTVEVVVPYAPGGGTDNLMRMITGIMDQNKWSPVPMNVNNRAGGSGAAVASVVVEGTARLRGRGARAAAAPRRDAGAGSAPRPPRARR